MSEDKILANKLKKFNVISGHPDDIIKRFSEAAKKYKFDVVVRFGDCPFISPEIIDNLIESHFTKGADYTAARNLRFLIIEVYNVNG